MATLLVNGDILEARVAAYQAPQAAFCTLHYRVAAVVGPITANDAATAVEALFAPLWKPIMTTVAEFRGVGIKRLFPIASVEDTSIVLRGPGTAGINPMPTQICGVVTKRTNFPGPSMRGRAYVPFPDEIQNDVLAGPAAAYLVQLAAIGGAIIQDVVVTVGANSCTLNAVLKHGNLTTDDLISFVARPSWGTQRRRGAFGQRNFPPM